MEACQKERDLAKSSEVYMAFKDLRGWNRQTVVHVSEVENQR